MYIYNITQYIICTTLLKIYSHPLEIYLQYYNLAMLLIIYLQKVLQQLHYIFMPTLPIGEWTASNKNQYTVNKWDTKGKTLSLTHCSTITNIPYLRNTPSIWEHQASCISSLYLCWKMRGYRESSLTCQMVVVSLNI